MHVELIYAGGCPNAGTAREHLLHAFTRLGLTPRWTEWDGTDPATPAHARGRGSPTILVNGADVDGGTGIGIGPACRLYANPERPVAGAPAVERIVAALRTTGPAGSAPARASFRLGFAVAPGIGLALLPKLVCPFCWPLYTSVLASVGVSFINYTPYLCPLTAAFLAAALLAIGVLTPAGRRVFALATGLLATLAILTGKFHLHNDWLVYGGILLLAASAAYCIAWNRRIGSRACAHCNDEPA